MLNDFFRCCAREDIKSFPDNLKNTTETYLLLNKSEKHRWICHALELLSKDQNLLTQRLKCITKLQMLNENTAAAKYFFNPDQVFLYEHEFSCKEPIQLKNINSTKHPKTFDEFHMFEGTLVHIFNFQQRNFEAKFKLNITQTSTFNHNFGGYIF